MYSHDRSLRRRFRCGAFLSLPFLLVACPAFAQRTPAPAPAPNDAATLSKYDANKNGVLDSTELAALDADRARTQNAVESAAPVSTPAAGAADAKVSGEVVTLSPFEVVSNTTGYYSANTMSGTRFNSKLEDLGSSISVITKEQMEDFAMLDINDVFLYAANAEGTGTYTDFTVNRNGDVQENVSMNPTQANRVRGIAAANVSLGNFETMGRTPVDPLGIDSLELSRGPNASVFGLGNPSGTINMVPSSANVTRDRTQLQERVDSYGGYRTSIDVNRVLLKNKLAVRVSGAFQHDAFQLKPSGVNNVRYNGMVRYQPFKNTSITAAYSYYRMNGNRPNASPLRDNLSYWLASGKPTWDPVTQVVHVNGQTLGPFTSDAAVPSYFNRSFTGTGRTYVYVGDSGIEWMSSGATTSSTNPGTGSGTLRYMSTSAGAGVVAGRPSGQPLFTTTPAITDKSIYDYTSINLAAINRVMDRNITGTVQLDQVFINTPRHTLAAQVAFMREDSQRYQRNTIGELNQNGQSSQLLIDANERRLDGSPNPFFLRPYIGIDAPYTIWQPQKWDTTRGQLGYKLDLSREKNLLHWIGTHQFSAYQEFKYRVSRRYSYQDLVRAVPGLNGLNVGTNVPRAYFRYYLGDDEGFNVDHAPVEITNGTYDFHYGNPTTGFISEPTDLPLAASTGRAGGGNNTQIKLRTVGGVVQSHFFDDRIVTTFGRREDKQYIKNGATPVQIAADGVSFDYEGQINHWAPGDYRFNSGITTQKGVVVRPFRGWSFVNRMESSGGASRILGMALNGLSLTYNKSDSFRPEEPRYNVYLQPLPNPYGTGKDYGFALNMFESKFVLRFNKYENKQVAARNGDAGTIAQRVLRADVAFPITAYHLQTQALAWITEQHPEWTIEQVQEEAGRQMGVPWARQVELDAAWSAGLISSPNDIVSKGTEIELNYNPTNFWTLAGSFTDTQSVNQNVSTEIQQWIDERMPIWTTIEDPRFPDPDRPGHGELWWNHNYGGSQTPAQNYATFVGSPYSVIKQLEGKASPQIRRYAFRVSTNFRLNGITKQKILRNMNVGGAIRWQDRGAIGYYGKQELPAMITELDGSRPIYDDAKTFIDAFVGYRMRLWNDKVGASFQLNVRNLTEGGNRLQPIGAYPDGTPHSYRIVDPRQFILQATFDL